MRKHKGHGRWNADNPSRSNTDSSTIRGRISAPFPIDDEEFPIRAPGTSKDTPVAAEGGEKQLMLPGSPHTLRLDRMAAANFAEPSLDTSSAHATPNTSLEGTRLTRETSTQRYSSWSSPLPTKSDGKPQRKKSSFKSVLGRLLGRKGRASAGPNTSPSSSMVREAPHRSDPLAHYTIPRVTAKRSASLPINDFDRALPSDPTAVLDLASNEAAEVAALALGQDELPKREATTRSPRFDPASALYLADWTGLTPRPASFYARSSHNPKRGGADEHAGLAIAHCGHTKRRSRSLGQLRAISTPARDFPRRRSDEIKSWKENYVPHLYSPISSNKAEVRDRLVLTGQINEAGKAGPDYFDLKPTNDPVATKITQAADLEARLLQLECRLLRLERIVSRTLPLTFVEPSQDSTHDGFSRPQVSSFDGIAKVNLDSPSPVELKAQYQAEFPEPTSVLEVNQPFTDDTRSSAQFPFQGFAAARSTPAHERLFVSSLHSSARRQSTAATIRAYPPVPQTFSSESYLTVAHYNSLADAIEVEQQARHRLEELVGALQQEVRVLHSLVPKPAGHVIEKSMVDEYSSFEHDDSSEGSSSDMPREEYQTPNEDFTFGDGPLVSAALGHEEDRTTTRTLSLSQLTMGLNQSGKCGT